MGDRMREADQDAPQQGAGYWPVAQCTPTGQGQGRSAWCSELWLCAPSSALALGRHHGLAVFSSVKWVQLYLPYKAYAQ